jgi:hypothetical protein
MARRYGVFPLIALDLPVLGRGLGIIRRGTLDRRRPMCYTMILHLVTHAKGPK